MSSPASESPPTLADAGELFAPPSWLARTLLAIEIAGVAAAAISVVVRMPLLVHLLLVPVLFTAAWVAHRARRFCHLQYLLTERSLTQLVRGERRRTLSFAEVTDFREVPSYWGGRRVRLTHEAGPIEIDLSFFGAQARRLFATLRYGLRPQFFRRIDEILTRGGRFTVRPGARFTQIVQMVLAGALGWLLAAPPLGYFVVPAAALLVLLQLDAACTSISFEPRGLVVRRLLRRRRVEQGQLEAVLFQSRARLFGSAERIIVLDCRSFTARIPDCVTEFEALAGALEGFSRRRETKGLAQL